MNKARIVLAGLVVAVCGSAVPAAYQPVEGKIMTRWAKEVSPTNALPDYPRPQMVRKDWKNLNGLWDYAIRTKDQVRPESFDGQILVPYPVESALSGVKKTVTPNDKLWYRLSFEVPGNWPKGKLLLHFGAVDFSTEVWVNGTKLGDHVGGYDPFSFDISNAVKSSGPQELVVAVTDPTDRGTQPRGKQVLRPGGIMYTAVTGIWQTVWLEPVPSAYIRGIKVTPDLDNQKLTVVVDAQGDAASLSFTADAKGFGLSASASSSKNTLTLTINNPKLWSPDAPNLYDLTVRLTDKDKTVDSIQSYFGMRKIALGKDEQGITRMMLNNKPLFQYGPLDQGWWPDGLLTPPSEEAMRYDLEVLKKIGMNMVRKHIKVEPARYYYDCDRMGLLVWQDMPSAINRTKKHFIRPGQMTDADDQFTDAEKKQFRTELKAMIDHLKFFPCIYCWVPFNEGWGQHDTNAILKWTKEYDPTRLVNGPSGWEDRGYGDMKDAHIYPGPGMFPVMKDRVSVLGEFGGLGLPVKNHLWKDQGNWGYRTYKTEEELRTNYHALMRRLHVLIGKGLAAAVYTQTTDVEIEVNGLMTYDREVMKFDIEEMAKWHKALFGPPPEVKELVPTSEKSAKTWKHTLYAPSEKWIKPDFDDSKWKDAKGGFGAKGTPGSVIGTEWTSKEIWLRRTFELKELPKGEVLVRFHCDEDGEVFINGEKAASLPGYTTNYVEVPILPAALKSLKVGTNTFAVRAKNAGGGQYIDVGLSEEVKK